MDVRSDWQSGNAFVKTNLVMLESEIATDVQFSFPDSSKIKAHRFILMSRSSVFFAMFSSGLQNANQDIIIQDVMSSIFMKFLRFLYGAKLAITENDALALLYTAEKYGVTTLKDKCVQFLEGSINEITVVYILEHALLYNVNTLSQKCLEYLSSLKGVLRALQHYQVSKTTLETILDCKSVKRSLSKVDIFKTCNKWAHTECAKRKIASSLENRREVLGDIFAKIPFQRMSIDDIAWHVSTASLLTQEEELEIYRALGKGCNHILKNVDPVMVQIPEKVNNDHQLARILSFFPRRLGSNFWIEIKCSKPFRILGFSFKKDGIIDLQINSKVERISVSNPLANTYMEEASVTDYTHVITAGVHPVRAERGAVPFSVSCRDGQFEFTGKAYIINPVPFQAMLVDFTDGN